MFKLVLGLVSAAAFVLLNAAASAQPRGAVPSPTDAPIALLIDLSNGQVLHSRGADRRFIPASVTKVMTLLHAFELMESGALSPGQTFTMSDETWRTWNSTGSTMWINAGEQVSVDDLLMGIANISANDASVLLAEGQAGSVEAWTADMNARARALGLSNSHFASPNGWPDDGQTFTSARDLALLASEMVRRHPELFDRYIGQPGFSYGGITQPNRDPLLGVVEGADGIKTGYTNEAGFTYLGTAERNGQRLVLVIAASPRAGVRARAARDYMEWGFSGFERRLLFRVGEPVATARVQGGARRDVVLVADRDVYVNLPDMADAQFSMNVAYDGPVSAPILAGAPIATLVIDVPGMEPVRLPLRAQTSVSEANLFQRIGNAFAGWFS